jgi:hypothetical protein
MVYEQKLEELINMGGLNIDEFYEEVKKVRIIYKYIF